MGFSQERETSDVLTRGVSLAVLGMESTSVEAGLSVLDAHNQLACYSFLGDFVMISQGALQFSLQTMPFKPRAGNFNVTETLAIFMCLQKPPYTSSTIPPSLGGRKR